MAGRIICKIFLKRRLLCCLITRCLPFDARKGKREGENLPFKIVPCASSLVTRVSRSPPLCDKQGVLVPRRPRQRKRQLKSGFAFVQSLSRLLQLIYYVEFKRTLFEPNSQEPHSRIERERKFSRRLFTSSIKRDISHFSVIVVQ